MMDFHVTVKIEGKSGATALVTFTALTRPGAIFVHVVYGPTVHFPAQDILTGALAKEAAATNFNLLTRSLISRLLLTEPLPAASFDDILIIGTQNDQIIA